MKRLLAFLALCIPLYLFAQGFGSFSHDQPFFAGDAVGSASDCRPPYNDGPFVDSSPVIKGFSWSATKITNPCNETNGTSIRLYLKKNVDFVDKNAYVTAYVWQDAGGVPGTKITNSENKSITMLSHTGFEWIAFSNFNCTLPTGTNFWVGISWSGTSLPTNAILWGYSSDVGVTMQSSNGISNWALINNSASNKVHMFAFDYVTNQFPNLYLTNWFKGDGIVWGQANSPERGATNGEAAWQWVNSVRAGTANWQDFYVFNSSTPGTGGLIYSDTGGPNGYPMIVQRTNFVSWQNTGTGSTRSTNTIIVLCKSTNTVGPNALFDNAQRTIAFDWSNLYCGSPSTTWYFGSGCGISYLPYSITNWTIFTLVYNGANSYVRTNGVLFGTGNPGANDFTAGGFMGNRTLAPRAFGGYVAEVLHYSAALDTNSLQAVERYLTNKYALTNYYQL